MKMSKNKEETKEPTIEEKFEAVKAYYGMFNRHERRTWGKMLKVKIPGLLKPLKKDNYELPPIQRKENVVCKNAEFVEDEETPVVNIGCKNLRVNGSSRCNDCKTK